MRGKQALQNGEKGDETGGAFLRSVGQGTSQWLIPKHLYERRRLIRAALRVEPCEDAWKSKSIEQRPGAELMRGEHSSKDRVANHGRWPMLHRRAVLLCDDGEGREFESVCADKCCIANAVW